MFAENVDIAEAKGLFEANFSHVYNILYDSFIQAEGNLRQRGKSLSFNSVRTCPESVCLCALLFCTGSFSVILTHL